MSFLAIFCWNLRQYFQKFYSGIFFTIFFEFFRASLTTYHRGYASHPVCCPSILFIPQQSAYCYFFATKYWTQILKVTLFRFFNPFVAKKIKSQKRSIRLCKHTDGLPLKKVVCYALKAVFVFAFFIFLLIQ